MDKDFNVFHRIQDWRHYLLNDKTVSMSILDRGKENDTWYLFKNLRDRAHLYKLGTDTNWKGDPRSFSFVYNSTGRIIKSDM